jgi:glycine cleavage system transcriptional repressor
MRQWFALSAIGADRPGIVADIAELIFDCDANLEDSSMTILGSEFAMLLLLSGEGLDLERRLQAGCKRLEWEKRLTVFFRPLDAAPVRGTRADAILLDCVVTGVDRAGIVARAARTLAERQANIVDLRTESRPEPLTGTPIYTMRLRIALPAGSDRQRLAADLERVAVDLRVELTLGEVRPSSRP